MGLTWFSKFLSTRFLLPPLFSSSSSLQYAFNVALLSIFGKDEVLYREELKSCYYILEKGYNSMPINLPGTLFHKAMKARKQLARVVGQILSSRGQRKEERNDLLGSFMGEKEALTDEQITDNMIGLIFAARDTTASVLTWIIKYLGENPSILQAVTVIILVLSKHLIIPSITSLSLLYSLLPPEQMKPNSNLNFVVFLTEQLQEEQEEIMKKRVGDGERSLTWADTKNMPTTSRVIQETMRVASVLSFTFREAVEDVEYEGW